MKLFHEVELFNGPLDGQVVALAADAEVFKNPAGGVQLFRQAPEDGLSVFAYARSGRETRSGRVALDFVVTVGKQGKGEA